MKFISDFVCSPWTWKGIKVEKYAYSFYLFLYCIVWLILSILFKKSGNGVPSIKLNATVGLSHKTHEWAINTLWRVQPHGSLGDYPSRQRAGVTSLNVAILAIAEKPRLLIGKSKSRDEAICVADHVARPYLALFFAQGSQTTFYGSCLRRHLRNNLIGSSSSQRCRLRKAACWNDLVYHKHFELQNGIFCSHMGVVCLFGLILPTFG